MGGSAAPGETDGSLFRVGDTVSLAHVLLFLSLLVVFVAMLEQLLHKLELRASKSHKHEEMLRKAYRELMILGFIGIGIKVFKEATHISAYSTPIIAFQVADLTIFILAITLIFQAICVFLLLRRDNFELDKAELLCASDLAESLIRRQRELATRKAWSTWWVGLVTSRHQNYEPNSGPSQDNETTTAMRDDVLDEVVQLRVLRHLFLRRYGLPELFPFSKYLRQAQDSQITHMIDVEISMWLLLLCVAWGIDGAIVAAQQVSDGINSEPHALVVVFFVFAWSLVALHIVVAVYFHRCVQQLLCAGGYNRKDNVVACLAAIGEDENAALADEMAGDALEVMQEVQDRQEARHRIAKGPYKKRGHQNPLQQDKGFQLLAMAVRHLFRLCTGRQRAMKQDLRTLSVETAATDATNERVTIVSNDPSLDVDVDAGLRSPRPHRRRSAVLPVTLRWFSRKAWHFIVMMLLMLNGFYLALLCQCVFYQLGSLSSHPLAMRVMILVALPLPVVLNMLVFQPSILRNFMIVSSVVRVDVDTLSEVVTHFSDIVELRAEFLHSLLSCLRTAGVTIDQLQCALEAKDRRRCGVIEVEQLRIVLRGVGFRLSHFRFNTVAKLLFRLRDTTVEYVQVLRMLALEDAISHGDASADSTHNHERHHVLLRQSVVVDGDDEDSVAAWQINKHDQHTGTDTDDGGPVSPETEDQARDRRAGPQSHDTVRSRFASGAPAVAINDPRRRLLLRQQSSFQATSSWALRALYHIDSTNAVDGGGQRSGSRSLSIGISGETPSPRATVYVRMDRLADEPWSTSSHQY